MKDNKKNEEEKGRDKEGEERETDQRVYETKEGKEHE